jgi:hypothetical protein
MLNAIMKIEILEIERVPAIASVQHVRRKVRDEEAEAGAEVVRGSDERPELVELDVFAVVGQDIYPKCDSTRLFEEREGWCYRDSPWHSERDTSTGYRPLAGRRTGAMRRLRLACPPE